MYKSFARGRNKKLVTEKFFSVAGCYMFDVDGTYNKHSVTNAIEIYTLWYILETIHEEPDEQYVV